MTEHRLYVLHPGDRAYVFDVIKGFPPPKKQIFYHFNVDVYILDPEIEAMLAPYRERVLEEGNKTIARTAVKLDGSCRGQECNFGKICLFVVSLRPQTLQRPTSM